jgi:hypothetical protein
MRDIEGVILGISFVGAFLSGCLCEWIRWGL